MDCFKTLCMFNVTNQDELSTGASLKMAAADEGTEFTTVSLGG